MFGIFRRQAEPGVSETSSKHGVIPGKYSSNGGVEEDLRRS